MRKNFSKIVLAVLVLSVFAGMGAFIKGNVDYMGEVLFMSLYLGILITLLLIIRRNKIFRQFIYDRTDSRQLPE